MDSKRLATATGMFLILSLVFSGVAGFAAASNDPKVFVPLPGPGDAASYAFTEVIDDPNLARGQVRFDWMRLAWQDEEIIPDSMGVRRPFEPLGTHIMFREGSEYEQDWQRTTYYDPAGPAFMDAYQDSITYGGDPGVGCFNSECLVGGGGETTAHRESRTVHGPSGVCGARSAIQGAAEPPASMQVSGYCRDYRIMDTETTTEYRFHDYTVWKGRDALEYRQVGTGWRIVYAEGVPFPVIIDLPLAEHIVEAYTFGRHFTAELRDFDEGNAHYSKPLVAAGAPLPTAPRVANTHLDEADMTGFTLAVAFQVAMTDTAAPRLADFMARDGAYLGAAYKNIVEDSDGRQMQHWHLLATDGDRILGKSVSMYHPALITGLPVPDGVEQYEVSDRDLSESWYHFPQRSAIPDQVPSLSAAMERSKNFDGVEEPNLWGFLIQCLDDGCADVLFAVRTGEELLPATSGGTEATPRDANYQYTVFFDQFGLLSHTWSWEADRGSNGLIPPLPTDGRTPSNSDGAQGSAPWLPPGPAVTASMGFIALLGASLYYFWPALKAGMFAPLFSRIADDKVLDHPRRRAIHDLIRADPGIHFQELSRRAGTGRGSLEHHLRKLRDADLVVRQQANGRTCYFPKGAIDHRDMQAASLLRADSTRRVYEAIQAAPGSQCADIARATGLSSPTVSYHLGKLRQAGLVGAGRSLFATA